MCLSSHKHYNFILIPRRMRKFQGSTLEMDQIICYTDIKVDKGPNYWTLLANVAHEAAQGNKRRAVSLPCSILNRNLSISQAGTFCQLLFLHKFKIPMQYEHMSFTIVSGPFEIMGIAPEHGVYYSILETCML